MAQYIDEIDIADNPAMSSMIQTQLNDKLLSEELENSLKEQYMNFENIGHNFLNDYDSNQITPEILIGMMNYIDDNIIGIEFMNQIDDHDRNTYTLIPMLYELLYVDSVTFILPNLMKEIGTKDPNDIKYLEPRDLKFKLLNVIRKSLIGFEDVRKLGSGLGNNKIDNEIFKYGYAVDLFDNDLEDFMENYIIPVVNNYNTAISNADV
jgi:hypothetical protein